MAKLDLKGKLKSALISFGTIVLIKVLPLLLIGSIIFNLLNFAKELIQGDHTYDEIISKLDTENLSDLIEVKGNEETGYYWGFVDDIDTKLDSVIEELTNNANTVTIKDKALLKKMIKAELVTQYPDLGGPTFSTDNTYSGSSEERAKKMLEDMTLDEKVSQMLFLLTSNSGDLSKNAGGYILLDGFDFSNTKSTVESASNNIEPVIATDEEGGNVERALSGYPDARSYGENQSYSKLEEDYTNKANALLEMGINMNLGPVADVSSENSYMGRRSFSDDYTVATECVRRAVRSMKSAGLMTSVKHFPGYSNATDTHTGQYTDSRTIEEIQQDIAVFDAGISEGASTVTVSHIIVEAIDDENPASLSTKVINEIRDLGFDGVVMTDAMNMEAVDSIEDKYVKAIKAGNDVLEVTDFDGAKQQILDAISRDDISVEQINESVTRILTMKFEYGVIPVEGEDKSDQDDIEIQETSNSFQGAIHLRRVMPDKEIGALENVSTGVPTEQYKYVITDNVGLGTKQEIPDLIKDKMEGKSMNGLYGTTYDNLSYLTIPYYNLEGEVKQGHLIVNNALADEVLLIFQELYKDRVKINRIDILEDTEMGIQDRFLGSDVDEISYAMKLDRYSRYRNNTSGFNDRVGYDGQESTHASGCAIDINPLINPITRSNSTAEDKFYPTNAEKYTNRNDLSWSEEEKNQKIDENSKIYEVFKKYGWSWGGEAEGEYKDYSHFEKTDLTVKTVITNNDSSDSSSDSSISGGNEFLLSIDEPDPNYTGYKWEIEDRDLVERVVTREFGGDYTGSVLVAQIIRDLMMYENTHKFDDIDEKYGFSGSSIPDPPQEATQDAKDAVAFVFDEGNSAVQHKIMCYYARDSMYSEWHESQHFIVEYQYRLGNYTFITRAFDIDSMPFPEGVTQPKENLSQKIQNIVNDSSTSEKYSVYVKNLNSGNIEVNLNNERMQSASLIKLFIMATAYDEKSQGTEKGSSISESDIKIMIERSDNDATNRIIDILGFDTINNYIMSHGYTNTQLNRKMLEEATNGDNYTSVEDVAKILEEIYNNQCVNEEYSQKMLEYLKGQTLTNKIPEGVPDGVEVANKTGELPGQVQNDAAIVYKTDTPYILVVMSSDIISDEDAISNIIDISGLVYDNISATTSSSSATQGQAQVNAGIRSRIFDLKYTPLENFRNNINSDDENVKKEALNQFTIDENGKILIATWNYNSNDGLKVTEKSFDTASSYTEKYTMPIEYLIAFYIDTRNKEFVSDLAELALDSEFVLAVQDNVTTTETIISQTVDYNTTTYPADGSAVTSEAWTEDRGVISTNLTETVSTSVELTYGDTWFMEFYKDVNYSSSNLSNIIAENSGTEVGDEGDYIGDFYLTAYCKWCNSPPGSLETASGNDAQPDHTIAVHTEYFNGQAVNGTMANGSKVLISGQVYTVEDVGDMSRVRQDNWVDIFIDGGDTQPSSSSNDPCNSATFSGSTVPVYVAENVHSANSSDSNVTSSSKRVDTTTIIQGNVTTQDYDTVASSTSTRTVYDSDRTRHVITTTINTTTSVESYAYEYETGQMHVLGNEQNFITIYNKNNSFKSALKPTWLFQVLAKQTRTANMVDLTKYLIYRANGQTTSYGVTTFNFNQYAPQDFEEIKSTAGLSLTDTIFTRDVFIEALQSYYNKTGNVAFRDNFLAHAGELYDTAVANNVNPELVVITAKTEGNFEESGGSYNYWGIAVPNGAGSGNSFSSFEEGVKGYATVIQSFMPGGSNETLVLQRYEERKNTGCDPNGYGQPGTFSGMQSCYSYLGKHGQAYSGSGSGGYYYMDPAIAGVTKIYATHEEFVEKCLNGGPEHADGTETTPWEQGQYTAWQVEKKLEVWEDIFGDYGSLSTTGGGNLVQSAVEVHKFLRENGFTYAQAGITVPNENGSTIDCSSYVTWVLINAGVQGFDAGMYQWTSWSFMANPYGWEVISQENVQPGDILVYSNHVEMYAGEANGQLLVYNCGGNYSISCAGEGGIEEASYSGHSLASALILRVPGF